MPILVMTADLFKAASVVVAFACHEWQMQLTQKITQICGREILNTFQIVENEFFSKTEKNWVLKLINFTSFMSRVSNYFFVKPWNNLLCN